jgi:hypothetical protein
MESREKKEDMEVKAGILVMQKEKMGRVEEV